MEEERGYILNAQFNNLIMSNANFLTATAAGEPAVGDPTARHNSATMPKKQGGRCTRRVGEAREDKLQGTCAMHLKI